MKNVNNTIIQNSIFSENFSIKGGVAFHAFYFQNMTLNNIQVYKNFGEQGSQGSLLLQAGNFLNLKHLILEDNFSEYGTITFIDVENVFLEDTILKNNGVENNGGALYIYHNNNFNIQNIQVLNNYAKKSGGGIFIHEVLQLQIKNIQLINNTAQTQNGGGMLIEQHSEVLLENILFQENSGYQGGGGLFVAISDLVQINNCTFIDNISNIQGTSIQLVEQNQLLIENVIFKQSKIVKINEIVTQQGGFISIKNGQNIVLKNSTFENSQCLLYGGAIYATNIINFDMDKLKFQNNVSYDNKLKNSQGGAIYVNQITNFNVKSCQFQNGQSYQNGGSIAATDITNMNIYNSSFLNNSVNFDKNSYIHSKQENYFISKGGAIFYKQVFNQIENFLLKNCVFQENQASSGGAVMIQYNIQQQIKKPQFVNLSFENNIADLGPSIRYLGDIELKDEDILQLKFKNNFGILLQVDVFQGYYQNEYIMSEDNSDFQLCSKGTYLEQGGSLFCEMCKQEGHCEGGYINIYPQPKYWRENINQTEFLYCEQNPIACKGNDTCSEGYIGTLCESCDYYNAYFEQFGNKCEKCDKKENIIFMIILRILFVFLMILSTIRTLQNKITTIMARKFLRYWEYNITKDDQTSAVIKILILHNQMLTASSFLKFNIPVDFLNIINIFGNPASLLSQSLECLDLPQNQEEYNRVKFNIQLITITMALLVLGIICLIVFLKTYGKVYSYFTKKGTLVSAIFVWFLNLQTGIITSSLGNIFCRQIGQRSFRISDISQECGGQGIQYFIEIRQLRMAKSRKLWLLIKKHIKQDTRILRILSKDKSDNLTPQQLDSIRENDIMLLYSGVSSPCLKQTMNKISRQHILSYDTATRDDNNSMTLCSNSPAKKEFKNGIQSDQYSNFQVKNRINSQSSSNHQQRYKQSSFAQSPLKVLDEEDPKNQSNSDMIKSKQNNMVNSQSQSFQDLQNLELYQHNRSQNYRFSFSQSNLDQQNIIQDNQNYDNSQKQQDQNEKSQDIKQKIIQKRQNIIKKQKQKQDLQQQQTKQKQRQDEEQEEKQQEQDQKKYLEILEQQQKEYYLYLEQQSIDQMNIQEQSLQHFKKNDFQEINSEQNINQNSLIQLPSQKLLKQKEKNVLKKNY